MDKKFTWFHIGADVPFEATVKYWFALMWQNFYLQAFIIAVAASIVMPFSLDGWNLLFMELIPIAMMVVISFLGFYKTYQEQKP